jgi:hypothetical protein
MKCIHAHKRHRTAPDEEISFTLYASDGVDRRAAVIVDMLPIGLRREIRDMFVKTVEHVLTQYSVVDAKAAATPIRTTVSKPKRKAKSK